jgi:hypothetical protein
MRGGADMLHRRATQRRDLQTLRDRDSPTKLEGPVRPFSQEGVGEALALLLQDSGRRNHIPAPTDWFRPHTMESTDEQLPRAEPQVTLSCEMRPEAATEHAKGETIRERSAEFLDQIENHASLISFGSVHDAPVRIEADTQNRSPDLSDAEAARLEREGSEVTERMKL